MNKNCRLSSILHGDGNWSLWKEWDMLEKKKSVWIKRKECLRYNFYKHQHSMTSKKRFKRNYEWKRNVKKDIKFHRNLENRIDCRGEIFNQHVRPGKKSQRIS